MPAKVKYFIRVSKDKPNSKKKKEKKKIDSVNILVRFYNGKKFDLTAMTQKQIDPKYWNGDSGIVRQRGEFKDAEILQKDLDDLKIHIEKEHSNTPNKSKINKDWLSSTIDKFYYPEKYLQDNQTLFGYIQHFINNSSTRINPKTGNPVCYKMRREYEVTFNYLKAYAKENGEPDFVDIDLEFYQKFVDFLRKKRLPINIKDKVKEKEKTKNGLSINTIGKKIQTLKIFLNSATEQGINQYHKYKSRSFVALSEDSDNIYLTKEELNKFYTHNFSSTPHLERVRDKFIVASWTGLRYSDLQQITPDKIKGDYIELKQKKTGKAVVIPIHYTVKEILEKYDGSLPDAISNQKYNEYLKDAAKRAKINDTFIKTVSQKGMKHEKKYPKHELISSHTARRSFCTNAYKDNIPTLAIMAISGHRTEQAFLKYIKADGKEHAEKVLKAWREGGKFIKVSS